MQATQGALIRSGTTVIISDVFLQRLLKNSSIQFWQLAANSTWCYYFFMTRRIFKTKTFNRWFKSTLLDDIALKAAVEEMERGLIDARLADCLYKKRLPLPGRGKRGSVRTIVCTKHEETWFFLFGFQKNERADISPVEKKALKKLAEDLLGLSADTIDKMLRRGEIEEAGK